MHECEQGRRKPDTLPGAGREDCCRSWYGLYERNIDLPFRIPGSGRVGSISECLMSGVCLSMLEHCMSDPGSLSKQRGKREQKSHAYSQLLAHARPTDQQDMLSSSTKGAVCGLYL